MELFLQEIKYSVENHPDYTEGDFEVKYNKGFETLYLCDIAVIRIIHRKNENKLEVADKYLRLFGLEEPNDRKSWIGIIYDDKVANTICSGIKEVFKKCYKDSAEYTFGCCSRFLECSEVKKCVCSKEYGFNNTKRFASGCMYKDNLDKGFIFYGSNRNFGILKK